MTSFINLQQLARRLGLPMAWLRAEAEAGRLPCLRAGRRLMFNITEVEDALARRDDREGGGDG
ncbi:MAG: hypothetical protein ACYTG1_02945 [Planctomycetota bacterium]|jgi:hypothetical protein